MDIMALKAGERWFYGAEKSIKYLNRLYKKKQQAQSMNGLRTPDGEVVISALEAQLPISQEFYQQLHTSDEVDEKEILDYLTTIRNLPRLSSQEVKELLSPITLDEILIETRKVLTKTSSPGEDDIGYALLYEIFRYPLVQDTLVQVFNQALLNQTVPTSWQENLVCLLPKKGDLSLLKNWRPISLINCDAKIFTRIMNTRIRYVCTPLITELQSGFMPGRWIADNGMMLQILAQHVREYSTPEVALLLDQEKAYDRIHPLYLRHVLLRLGFLKVCVNSLIHLFFGNRVRINVNGHYTDYVDQQRGLRQGDPLSPPFCLISLWSHFCVISSVTTISKDFDYIHCFVGIPLSSFLLLL
jgi:hypothetical protein